MFRPGGPVDKLIFLMTPIVLLGLLAALLLSLIR